MSKQLAISACASIFAMAAFVLSTTPSGDFAAASAMNRSGAATEVTAPAIGQGIPALFNLLG